MPSAVGASESVASVPVASNVTVNGIPTIVSIAFWIAVLVYGVLRGLGVRFVTETIGASFPYSLIFSRATP